MKDDDIDVLQRGQAAALAKGEVYRRLAQQEQDVMAVALARFRAGSLSGDAARDVIAQIAALRDLAFSLDKDVRKASETRLRIMSPGSKETATRS